MNDLLISNDERKTAMERGAEALAQLVLDIYRNQKRQKDEVESTE